MFELIGLLLEARSSGTLAPDLQARIDVVVADALKGLDALQAWQFEEDYLRGQL